MDWTGWLLLGVGLPLALGLAVLIEWGFDKFWRWVYGD